MLMYLKNFILISIMMLISKLSICQSSNDKELHNRYGTYRENFRKYFTKIGADLGEGLAFSDISIVGADNIKVNPDGSEGSGQVGLNVRLTIGGDVTAFMSEYMGVLASEYKLLKINGKGTSEEMKAVKNELYFVINAIERLDKGSKRYFEGKTTDEKDGFFIRDDENPNIIKYFDGNNPPLTRYNYPKVTFMSGIASQGRELTPTNYTAGGPPVSDYSTKKYISWLIDDLGNTQYFRFNKNDKDINGKYIDEYAHFQDPITDQSRSNEMSMDQLIGVLFGFKCILKFVEEDVNVDPDGLGPLTSKNLCSWVRDLANALMTKIDYPPIYGLRIRTPEELEDHPHVFNPKIIAHANYVITNPHLSNEIVKRGPFAYAFGYPFEKLGEELTGQDYKDVKVTLNAKAQFARYFEDILFKSLIGYGGALLTTPDGLSLTLLNRPFQPHNSSWWRDLYNFLPKNKYFRNLIKHGTGSSMHIWLPPAAGVWEHSNYFNMMDEFNREEADLFWCVLNDDKYATASFPFISAEAIESSLLGSNCEAIQNAVDESTNSPFNKISHFSKIASNGNELKNNTPEYAKNYGTNPDDKDNVQLYNGLDWMLVYNFYRLSIENNFNYVLQNSPKGTPYFQSKLTPHFSIAFQIQN